MKSQPSASTPAQFIPHSELPLSAEQGEVGKVGVWWRGVGTPLMQSQLPHTNRIRNKQMLLLFLWPSSFTSNNNYYYRVTVLVNAFKQNPK